MNLQPINIADSSTNTHMRATLQPINIADSSTNTHTRATLQTVWRYCCSYDILLILTRGRLLKPCDDTAALTADS